MGHGMSLILADAGLPMIMLQMPALVITLPVVIAIEVWICMGIFKTKFGVSLVAASAANAVSTLFGFPLLWFGWLGWQFLTHAGGPPQLTEPWSSIYSVTVEAPWIFPYENRGYWMIPIAMLVLLIPSFFLSVFVEQFIYKWILKKRTDKKDFNGPSWTMHFASYGFLVFAGLVLLATSLFQKHLP